MIDLDWVTIRAFHKSIKGDVLVPRLCVDALSRQIVRNCTNPSTAWMQLLSWDSTSTYWRDVRDLLSGDLEDIPLFLATHQGSPLSDHLGKMLLEC